jgi:predicted alpha/beta-fold hydrolase
VTNLPSSLGIPPFRPPLWLQGGHAQTVAGTFWPGRLPRYQAEARRVTLDDGDVIVVHDDCPPHWQPGGLVTMLIHGLAGCHLSPYMVRIAAKLAARGVRVFRMELRGCGAGAGLARWPYHAGRSDDVRRVVASVAEWTGGSPLVLVGFSLSGNILLKYLGEAPDLVLPNVSRAIAVNPPIDLERCVRTLDRFANRSYDRHFVALLLKQLDKRRRILPDAPMPAQPLRSRRLFDFDDWYTAPISGYGSAREYYERCSSAQFLPRVRVPTTVLTARNDPLVPVEVFQQQALPESVRLVIAEGGGHLGYIARANSDPDTRWLDWRVVDWVTGLTTV